MLIILEVERRRHGGVVGGCVLLPLAGVLRNGGQAISEAHVAVGLWEPPLAVPALREALHGARIWSKSSGRPRSTREKRLS